MKCISFNINSVRARPHQLIHLRDNLGPDVIGLQETKVDDPEFPMEEINEIGYHAEHWGCLLYTSPSPRDSCASRMPSSA